MQQLVCGIFRILFYPFLIPIILLNKPLSFDS